MNLNDWEVMTEWDSPPDKQKHESDENADAVRLAIENLIRAEGVVPMPGDYIGDLKGEEDGAVIVSRCFYYGKRVMFFLRPDY